MVPKNLIIKFSFHGFKLYEYKDFLVMFNIIYPTISFTQNIHKSL